MRWGRFQKRSHARDHYIVPEQRDDARRRFGVRALCGREGHVHGPMRYQPRAGRACQNCVRVWRATEEHHA